MIPLASAASASYQNVFGILSSNHDLYVLCIGVAMMVGLALMFFSLRKTEWQMPTVGGLLFLMGVVGICVLIPQVHNVRAAISADIQQKYGATLDKDSGVPAGDNALAQPSTYKLDFPNGTSGEYSLRFDRQTSEPILVSSSAPTAPTPEQLEQSAKK